MKLQKEKFGRRIKLFQNKKILKVLSMDDALLKSIGKEGRKNIIQKFNVEKMCFSTYSEYKKILN